MAILGFDAYAFPGAPALLWLRQNANFRFTGFYLAPAPRHPDASWMGARAFLAANGWGTIPTYVGLQVEDGGLSTSTGAQHGHHAAALMQQAGFPVGSVVYLDLEKPDLTPAFTAYIDGWLQAVAASGFVPALYGSHLVISFAQSRHVPIWSFRIPNHTAGQTYDPHNLPAAHVDAGAIATQYRQNVGLTGFSIPLDLDISSIVDPSHFPTVNHHMESVVAAHAAAQPG